MKDKSLRIQAMKLRLQGYSYTEIGKRCRIAKSTLSGWFRNMILSERARTRLQKRERTAAVRVLIRRNKLQTHHAKQRAALAHKEGVQATPVISNRELLFAGTALYWAEGYKRLKMREGREIMSHTISFVNSDSQMIRVFIQFLKDILSISPMDVRAYMRLYAHINEKEALRYWMRVTGLPRERFFKTSFLVSGSSKGKRPYNRLPWGTVQLEVCNTQKFHYLLGLIEGVKKYF